MREEILEILQNTRDDVDFESQTALIDDKILDSFDVVSIAGELMDEYDIQLTVEHLIPENFNTLDAIVALIESLVNE